jgi:hypothetical protein
MFKPSFPLLAAVAALVTALSPPARAHHAAAHAGPASAREGQEEQQGFEEQEEQQERQAIGAQSPRALQLLEEAETQRRSGRLAEALPLLVQARAQAPTSGPLARRHCELLTALGRRGEAVAVCDQAVSRAATPHTMRAAVAALLASPTGPTTQELFRSWLLAEAAVRSGPRQPWGHAARFDLARAWGDPEMMARSLADLRAVAPAHEETRRAMAAAPVRWSGLPLGGWILLALFCLGTLARAARAAILGRRPKPAVPSPSVAVLALAGLMGLGAARAEAAERAAAPAASAGEGMADMSKYRIDDADPAASVPTVEQQNGDPLQFGYFLQDLIVRGQRATDRRDHAAAVRYYLALAKAVPTRATAFSKLCESLEAAGRTAQAIEACRAATGLEGVVASDYLRLAQLILAKHNRPLAPADVAEVEGITTHLQAQEGARAFGYHVQCQLGLRLEDIGRLERCTAGLVKEAPGDAKTISFQWALAIKKGERDQARALVARAQQAGVAPEGLARMREATEALGAPWKRWLLDRRLLLAASVIAALAAVVYNRRRRGLQQTA